MATQTRAEVENLIADLIADNHDGSHDSYIAWLNTILGEIAS